MRKTVQELMECYQDQKLDITDKFVDGVCYTKIEGKDKTLYLTVKYDNGYAHDKRMNGYPLPIPFFSFF